MPEDMTPVLLTNREREWLVELVQQARKSSEPLDVIRMARAVGAYNSAITDLVFRLEPR